MRLYSFALLTIVVLMGAIAAEADRAVVGVAEQEQANKQPDDELTPPRIEKTMQRMDGVHLVAALWKEAHAPSSVESPVDRVAALFALAVHSGDAEAALTEMMDIAQDAERVHKLENQNAHWEADITRTFLLHRVTKYVASLEDMARSIRERTGYVASLEDTIRSIREDMVRSIRERTEYVAYLEDMTRSIRERMQKNHDESGRIQEQLVLLHRVTKHVASLEDMARSIRERTQKNHDESGRIQEQVTK